MAKELSFELGPTRAAVLTAASFSLQNLEYLEAEYYSWAAFGYGLDSSLTGGGGPVTGGQKAALSGAAQAYAEQIAIVSYYCLPAPFVVP